GYVQKTTSPDTSSGSFETPTSGSPLPHAASRTMAVATPAIAFPAVIRSMTPPLGVRRTATDAIDCIGYMSNYPFRWGVSRRTHGWLSAKRLRFEHHGMVGRTA